MEKINMGDILRKLFIITVMGVLTVVCFYLLRYHMYIPMCFLIVMVVGFSMAVNSKEMKENEDGTLSEVKEEESEDEDAVYYKN